MGKDMTVRSMIYAEGLFLLTEHVACMATVHYI